MKASIWTVEGRFERIKKKVDEYRLQRLKDKRDRQLTRLIEKYQDDPKMTKKVNRWKDKLYH